MDHHADIGLTFSVCVSRILPRHMRHTGGGEATFSSSPSLVPSLPRTLISLSRLYVTYAQLRGARNAPRAFDTAATAYLRAQERVERASASCEMQEFKGAFSVRSTATPGVILVIDGAIKARARRRVESRVSCSLRCCRRRRAGRRLRESRRLVGEDGVPM